MRVASLFAGLSALALSASVPVADALNVAIISTFGTRSDIAPIFEGLRDFAMVPGNKVTFIAAGKGLASGYASNFKEYVETVVVDELELPEYLDTFIPQIMEKNLRIDNTAMFLDGINLIADVYETNVQIFMEQFRKYKFDLVMCDAVEQSCMDAAKETKTKLTIYGPLGQYGVGADWYVPDFLDPVSVGDWIASPWRRAKGYIDMIPFVFAMLQARSKIIAAQAKLNMTMEYLEPWDYPQRHMMLSHHVLGIDPARSVPTNIQVFGPIVHEANIPPLEPEFQVALDNFKAEGTRVVFIAFGTLLTFKKGHVLAEELLAGIETLISDKERNVAVIWASRHHHHDMIAPLQAKYPGRLLTPTWVNQRRCLMHESVKVMFSHAGYGSMSEALLEGKAQLMMPLVFDEFLNAHLAEEQGIALQMDKSTMTADEMATKIQWLLDETANPASEYSRTLQKWQTIGRLGNERAKVIVSNAVTLAATVGVDHLVPPDVKLSIFDRFAVGPMVLIFFALRWLLSFACASSRKTNTKTKTA
ncbi:hypothetical protein Poli38472_009322 [Pythium oligandrum]|uniref:Uncharacterized protein n=1 Tax=Pythium oligandrum TaxID=41045 RepID=A0A8K1CKX6_PYTOL|nr:hypothetical protein Poli38472_009322 [Pythium oligandrum]|eukprot:TMW65155.1 hypothetical protein Poli38472_009322 [Pythium oligandrum]